MSKPMLEATEAIVKERNDVSLILQTNAGWGFFLHIPKNSQLIATDISRNLEFLHSRRTDTHW